jgi:hypothetical protein
MSRPTSCTVKFFVLLNLSNNGFPAFSVISQAAEKRGFRQLQLESTH